MLTMPSLKKSLIVEQLQGNYLKYAYFSKCYLERFASISAPEK